MARGPQTTARGLRRGVRGRRAAFGAVVGGGHHAPSALPAEPSPPVWRRRGCFACALLLLSLCLYAALLLTMPCSAADVCVRSGPSALPAEPSSPCGVAAGAFRVLCCCCRGAYMRLFSYLCHAALMMCVCGVGGRRAPWPIGPPCRTPSPVLRRRGCFACALLLLSWHLYAPLPCSAADGCVRSGWEACAVAHRPSLPNPLPLCGVAAGALRVLCCCCRCAYMRLSS